MLFISSLVFVQLGPDSLMEPKSDADRVKRWRPEARQLEEENIACIRRVERHSIGATDVC